MATTSVTSHSDLALMEDRRIPAARLPARFGISARTFERWLKDPKLGFPRPVFVHHIRYFSERELLAWESSLPHTKPKSARAFQVPEEAI